MTQTRRARGEQIFFLSAARGSDLGLNELARVEVERPFKEILGEWRTIMDQVGQLVNMASQQAARGRLPLSQVEVSLGFSVTGKIVLVSEATAEASVTLTFAQPTTPQPDGLKLSSARLNRN